MKITLLDDGTLDTVVELTCPDCGHVWEWRYSDTSGYRDENTGALDTDTFFSDVVEPDFNSDGCPRCVGGES